MREHLIRYLLGGLFVFMVSIGLLYLFVDVLGVWYLWGTTAAFVLSMGISFSVQKYWTFRSHSTSGLPVQMGAYAVLQVVNLGANDLLMYIAVGKIGIPHLIAQVGTMGTIAVWSFLAYRYLFVRPA
ncbi:MAG: GtrA family protein [Patescibacteria group bacterium]